MLSKAQLKRVQDLMSELHSFASLVEKIEHEQAKPKPDSAELRRLLEELSRGLNVAFELTKALNRTALALHVQLLSPSEKS